MKSQVISKGNESLILWVEGFDIQGRKSNRNEGVATLLAQDKLFWPDIIRKDANKVSPKNVIEWDTNCEIQGGGITFLTCDTPSWHDGCIIYDFQILSKYHLKRYKIYWTHKVHEREITQTRSKGEQPFKQERHMVFLTYKISHQNISKSKSYRVHKLMPGYFTHARIQEFCQGPGLTARKQLEIFLVCFSPKLILQFTDRGRPMVLLQRKLYFSKDPEWVQHFPRGVQLFSERL